MKWNADLLNKYVAPAIGEFTRAEIPDLSTRFPQARYWLVNHFLNTVLRASFKEQYRQVVLGYLRRTHDSFIAYHNARGLTLAYLADNDPLNPKISAYYDAVSAWEHFVLQTSMALDLFKWVNLGRGAFEKKDGSKEERLYTIANCIKHTTSCVKSGQCKEHHTAPLWLTNDGIVSFDTSVSYCEVSGVLADIAKLADEFQDPLGFRGVRNGDAAECH